MRIETARAGLRRRSRTPSARSIPQDEIDQILDNIGLPSNNYNFAFSDGSFVAYNDGQMLISLKEGHGPVGGLHEAPARRCCCERFPDVIVYFQPADIITQILNFGIAHADRRAGLRPATRRRTWRSPSASCSG